VIPITLFGPSSSGGGEEEEEEHGPH